MEEYKRDELLKLLEQQVVIIETQIAKLKIDADAIRRARTILRDSSKQIPLMVVSPLSSEFENAKPTPAILQFLNKEEEKEYRVSELVKELLRRGMIPRDEKTFPNIISAVANRLALAGKIERVQKSFGSKKKKVWVYRKKRTGI